MGKMKAYSIDFREKIVKAYEQGNTSIRKVSSRFDVSKAFVQKLLKQKKTQGHLEPGKPGGGIKSELDGYATQLAQMVEKYPDATLPEYCEYWGETHNQWVSTSTMCRALQRQQLTRKKRLYAAVKAQLQESKNLEVSTGSKSRI
jgi:transposase